MRCVKFHHQLVGGSSCSAPSSPGGAGQAGKPGGPGDSFKRCQEPAGCVGAEWQLSPLLAGDVCLHYVTTQLFPRQPPGEALGAVTSRKEEVGGGGLCTQETHLRAGHPREY